MKSMNGQKTEQLRGLWRASVAGAFVMLTSAACADEAPQQVQEATIEEEAVTRIDDDPLPTVTLAAAMDEAAGEDAEEAATATTGTDQDVTDVTDRADPATNGNPSAQAPGGSRPAAEIAPPAIDGSTATQSGGPVRLDPGSIYSGTYTAAQAARGAEIVQRECAMCHSTRDWSEGKLLRGFSGRSVFDLVSHIRSTMPMDAPGRLTEQQYTDIVAYLFELNAVPAGDAELGTDREVQEQYRIEYRQ